MRFINDVISLFNQIHVKVQYIGAPSAYFPDKHSKSLHQHHIIFNLLNICVLIVNYCIILKLDKADGQSNVTKPAVFIISGSKDLNSLK